MGTKSNYNSIAFCLQKVSSYLSIQKEKNLFALGGRRHYENPISDLLLFFANPLEEHGFKDLILKSLLECYYEKRNTSELPYLNSFLAGSREVITKGGNRIDLLFEGDSWVITIENKIYHGLNNPLDDYYSFICNEESYRNKTGFFIVLAVNKSVVPEPWVCIIYEKLLLKIQENLGKSILLSETGYNTKWMFFLREFLMNINYLIGAPKMDKEKLSFIQNNLKNIEDAISLRKEYFDYISNECIRVVQEIDPQFTPSTAQVQNWELGYAIRTYCPNFGDSRNNIAFVVMKDGTYNIQFYIYGIKDNLQAIEAAQNEYFSEYRYWPEVNESIKCFGKEKVRTLDEAFDWFKIIAQALIKFSNTLNVHG